MDVDKAITSPEVYSYLLRLGQKHEEIIESGIITDEILKSMVHSPRTQKWISEMVLPQLFNGDDGLETILKDIEREKNNTIGATKYRILMAILNDEIQESLETIKDGVLEGDIDPDKFVEVFNKKNGGNRYLH